MSRTRRQRTPFNASRKRLEIAWVDEKMNDHDKRPYVPRWFNDDGDRLARAEAAGYEYVDPQEIVGVGGKEVHGGNSDLGSKVSKVVGKTESKEPIRAVLMKIKREWYDEDQNEKEQKNRMVDEALRSGNNPGGTSVENKYGNVDISR